jgi:hypothetical protein
VPLYCFLQGKKRTWNEVQLISFPVPGRDIARLK